MDTLSVPGVVRIYVCEGMCIIYHRPPLCSTTYAGALKFYDFPQRFSGANLLFILRSRWGWIQRSLRKEIARGWCVPCRRERNEYRSQYVFEKGPTNLNGHAISVIRWCNYASTKQKNRVVAKFISIDFFFTNHVWRKLKYRLVSIRLIFSDEIKRYIYHM